MAAGTVRDWQPKDVLKYIKVNGRTIAQAAMRGDKISLSVIGAYGIAYHVKAQAGSREFLSLCDALNDYILRDLNIREREILAGTIGHRVEEEAIEPGKLILPPGFDQ